MRLYDIIFLMIKWLLNTFWGTIVATFIISMIPVVELRGGVPFGVANGLPLWVAYITAVAGNMLPVPFIILFLRHIFNKLRNYDGTRVVVEKLEKKAHLQGEKVIKYRGWGLFILVAIPLPGTGAWTGALVTSVLDIRLRTALPIILAGVCVSGAAMLLLSHGVVTLF